MDMLVDSKEGIQALAQWFRAHGFVANEYHREIAEKYGVDFTGIIVAGRL